MANTPYLSLLRFENEIRDNTITEVLPLIRQEVDNAISSIKPFQKGIIFQSICRLTTKLRCNIVIKPTVDNSFENQILTWVMNQVNNNTQPPLTISHWKKLKCLDSWLEIFFQGALIAPKNTSLDNIIPLAISDFKNDYRYSFKLSKICWEGQRDNDFQSALDNCLSASVQNVDERFEILDFLSDKANYREQFLKIARATILSETKNIDRFQQLLTQLIKQKLWELAIACTHRIISLAEDQNNHTTMLAASANLVYAELQLSKPHQAAQAYQKYWYSKNAKSEFPYVGELILSFHASSPHDKIIDHLCSNISQEKHLDNLNQENQWAFLIEAKRLEFEGNWERAMDYWTALYEMFKDKDEKWVVPIACFAANNGLLSKNDSVVSYALELLRQSSLHHTETYRRIILTLQICLGGKELSSMQILQALRLEYGNNEDFENAELLPDEEQVFSEYLVPRVLEALLVENQRKLFYKSLNKKITRRRLPKYERLFIYNLIRIDNHILERRSIFKPDESINFIYDCHSALKLPLTNRQLLLLTERITSAENYILKDQFGDYENTEIAHLMNVILWLVAFRCEKLFIESGNLSEIEKKRRDEDIKNMTIQSAASTLRQFVQKK
ncbi:MAG: hypothetical protein IPO21_11150 [Bacteroidales bacterium]|nr:hypothetical protein [Bacteroidales bacterium]